MAISIRRVFLGGLAAGIFVTASGATLGHFVLGEGYVAAFRSHMATPPGAWFVAENVALRLGFGFLLAFLYAAMRPRLGPGPRTAVVAGAILWLAAFLPFSLALLHFGILAEGQFPIALGWGFGELAVGGLLAGWIYRE